MKMLQLWNGDSMETIRDFLTLWGIEANDLKLLKFEILSPDSSIWVINVDKKCFCLYMEDYVGSLDYVIDKMQHHGTVTNETDNYKLMEIKYPEDFITSSPVSSADIYEAPEGDKEFIKYAGSSDNDFVFLGKSTLN